MRTVLLGGPDTNGILRGKRVGRPVLGAALEHGIALSEAIWALPLDEREPVAPPAGHRGYFPSDGYPDVLARPDLATTRLVPWQPSTALVLCDFLRHGEALALCPREVLRRVAARARAMGFEARVGVELEFYLLRETPATVAAKRPEQLHALETRPSAYGVVAGARQGSAARLLSDCLLAFGLDIAACHPEAGPGQLEITLGHADALAAADAAFLVKAAVKDIAARLGLLATFMARPRSDWPGSSCHLHLSLRTGDRDAFFDGQEVHGMSGTMRHFVAGTLATIAELSAIMAPTPNSYRRPRPYSWAATTATWSLDNRSAGLRAVSEGEGATRIEHRQPGADVNPYLAVAAALAAGLHGIERGLAPPPPLSGDLYALGEAVAPPLPRELGPATDCLQASPVARSWLGSEFVEHYAALRRAELTAAADAVTDWETARYLEAL